jgi:hypothetical protein
MKRSICYGLIAFGIHQAAQAQCHHQGEIFARLDVDSDGQYELRAALLATRYTTPQDPFMDHYAVRSVLSVRQTGSVLKATASRIDFSPGELVTTGKAPYLSSDNLPELFLIEYDCTDFAPATEAFGEFRTATSAIIGAKSTHPDTGDVTLAWFKFTRPTTDVGTAFTLESWAYNPIPNEPIRAGFPPDLPEPQFAVSGENSENLDVSWPAKASMLRLETTDSLTPPVQWKPVDTGGATTVTLPAGEAQGAFFRLVAPEL